MVTPLTFTPIEGHRSSESAQIEYIKSAQNSAPTSARGGVLPNTRPGSEADNNRPPLARSLARLLGEGQEGGCKMAKEDE